MRRISAGGGLLTLTLLALAPCAFADDSLVTVGIRVVDAKTGHTLRGVTVTDSASGRTFAPGSRVRVPASPSGQYTVTCSVEGFWPETRTVVPKLNGSFIDMWRLSDAIWIKGVVRSDLTGEPLVGARVLLRNRGVSTTTDTLGAYALPTSPLNNCVIASLAGYYGLPQYIGTKTVNIDLVLYDSAQAPAVVWGRVVEMDTKRPMVGANVCLDGPGYGTVADSLGYYRIGCVPPGRRKLLCSYIAYDNQELMVEVRAAESLSADFQMVPTPCPRFRVIPVRRP